VIWLLGVFTPRLHAVADPTPRLMFHSVPVVWALCGAPAQLVEPHGTFPTCPRCRAHLNSPPVGKQCDIQAIEGKQCDIAFQPVTAPRTAGAA
jgi:hypothetical protein